jgi:hypothetical protein
MYSPSDYSSCNNRIYRIFESSNFNIKSIHFMNYSVKASISSNKNAAVHIKESEISFDFS